MIAQVRGLIGLAVVVAACGRVGFESRDRDTGADASLDDVLTTPIDAGPCDESPCKLVPEQCGCGGGQACQRVGATTDDRACIAEGTTTPGEVCTLDAQCVAGHACVALRAGDGRCQRYCAGDADCTADIACASLVEGVGIGLCGSNCTLDGGCGSGLTCKVLLLIDFDSPGPVAHPVCDVPTGGLMGASCASSTDCAAELFCDVSASGTCRPMCRFDGSRDCAAGAGTCTIVDAPIVLAGIAHGVCR